MANQKSASRDTGCNFANILAHIYVGGGADKIAAFQDIKITYRGKFVYQNISFT